MGNLWHVRNWFSVGRAFSWRMNFQTVGSLISFITKGRLFKNASERKHEFILDYFDREFSDIIEKYKQIPETYVQAERHIIWVCWWQGLDNAPDLVKACVRSIQRNAGNAKVVIITTDNLKTYLDIPDYIQRQFGKRLSHATFADIVRIMLLEKYGGLWLDATIFCSDKIPEEVFQHPYYSLHTNWAEGIFVQHNLYHSFVIGAMPHSKLVSFVKAVDFEYWKTRDVLIDYYAIDYILMCAYRNLPDIRAEIDGLEYTSERLYELVDLLDEPFDEEHFKKLSEECLFSKLNWHRGYKTESNGKMTYYGKLLSL